MDTFTTAPEVSSPTNAHSATLSNVAGVKAIRPKLLMQSGHVLVRFNLSESVDDQDAIDPQLRQAKLVIKKRQQEYMKANEIAALKGHEAKPIYFLRSLRLLDLLDGKNSLYSQTGRALRLVNGHGEGELTEKEARAKYKQQIGQARRLASDGYRHLANREGCPKPKSFR